MRCGSLIIASVLAALGCEGQSRERAGARDVLGRTSPLPSVNASAFPRLTEPELRLQTRRRVIVGVGEVAKSPDYSMRVMKVKKCKVETYFQPKPGNIKLGVEVEYRGLSDAEVPINPFHAKLSDSTGTEYTSTLAGCSPNLRSRRLSKGQRAVGYITFEVPETATQLVLGYTPFIVGRPEEKLEVALGR